jgi:hypothetical protein
VRQEGTREALDNKLCHPVSTLLNKDIRSSALAKVHTLASMAMARAYVAVHPYKGPVMFTSKCAFVDSIINPGVNPRAMTCAQTEAKIRLYRWRRWLCTATRLMGIIQEASVHARPKKGRVFSPSDSHPAPLRPEPKLAAIFADLEKWRFKRSESPALSLIRPPSLLRHLLRGFVASICARYFFLTVSALLRRSD